MNLTNKLQPSVFSHVLMENFKHDVMRKIIICFLMVFFFLSGKIYSGPNPEGFVVSGYVRDVKNGEELFGATVFVEELKSGTITNHYGFYSVNLSPGTYTFVYSFIGYQPVAKKIEVTGDHTYNIELSEKEEQLDEVVVQAQKMNANVVNAEMSVAKMEMKQIKKIPALMGEVDVIKAIQLLPGVQSTSEGSSGFSVRGGGRDQNLILLDEATLYNASHLMGFFSVFNNDAINEIKLYKGDIPAYAGGRLSSLLDVRMKNGNSKKFSGTGGIGTISSRLTLEGPIMNENTSFIISGRRSYADLLLMFSKKEELKDNTLYFYDGNVKVNHKINDNNRIFLSGYFGKDKFESKYFMFGFGNRTLTARWNHLFSKSLFANFSAIYSLYDYHLGAPGGEANSFIWTSNLHDYSVKSDFDYFLSNNNHMKFGVQVTRHKFEPVHAKGLGDKSIFNEMKLHDNQAFESGIYVSNEQQVFDNLTVKYGLRYSLFQNIGSAKIYKYDDEHNATDQIKYDRWEVFNTYSGLEPRLGFNYVLNDISSVKGSYSRTNQYIHLASNSISGSPLDLWFPSSPHVKPQVCDQFALGYFRNFAGHKIETSLELFYKDMDNVIDFKDHAEIFFNEEMEGELRFGQAKAWGAEFLTRLNFDKLSGWFGYTYTKTQREIPEINNGNPYPAPYDKPHDLSLVLSYELNQRWSISSTFVYATGTPLTIPANRWEYKGSVMAYYTERNSAKMPDYHRMDLSLSFKNKDKPEKRWKSEWNLSVYNVYNRKTPWIINFVQDRGNPRETYAEKTYLFPILPTITYNFKF
jgi:hypothetical protein